MQSRLFNLLRLFAVVLFSSCYTSIEFQVQLSPTSGLNREMGITTHSTQIIASTKEYETFVQGLGLEEFIITSFQHRPLEFAFRQWKEGKKDSAQFTADLKQYDDTDEFPFTLPELDAESLFLFGRKKEGTYLLIVDANNNNSFTDDTLYTIENPIEKGAATDVTASFPTIRIDNLQGFYKGKVFDFSSTVNLRPTLYSPPNTYNKRLIVNLLSSESYTGSLHYKGRTYQVAARSGMGAALLNTQRGISLKFAARKDDSPFLKNWDTRPSYKANDTVVLGKDVFWIKQVSPLLREVTLNRVRVPPGKVRKKEIDPRMLAVAQMDLSKWEGKTYPYFSITENNRVISNESLRGKMIFINFWFEACPPCIAEFEALSLLYDRLKSKEDFAFISFTFESSTVIEKARKKYGLTFPIYSISQEECERLNFGNGYPTNILINKDGKVQLLYAGGETSKDAAKSFIEENFYKRIIQGL